MTRADRAWIVNLLCITALLGACAQSESRPPPAAAPPTTTAAAPPTTTAAPAGLRPGERLLHLGVVRALAIDDSAVYAETSQYATMPVGPDTIVRLDRRTGKTISSGPILGYPGQLVSTGRWLWVDDWPISYPQGGHHAELVQLDARTLAVRLRISLPDQFVSLAASPTILWVGAPTRLLRLDPDTGHFVSAIALQPGDRTNVAIDPEGRLLYVAQGNVGLDPTNPNQPYKTVVLTERDATTGALLASRSDLPSVVGAALSPIDSPGGVWVSFPTGMLGQVQLLRAGDLATKATFSSSSGGGEAGTNGVDGTVSGGRLWVTDGIGLLSCADPATGRLLSTRPFLAAAVISDGSTLYAATDAGLALLRPMC